MIIIRIASMKKFKNHTLQQYLDILSKRTPTPGGGSAAALTGALGAALIGMAASYAKGKGNNLSIEKNIQKTIMESEKIKKELLGLVDLDCVAYLRLVKSRNSPPTVRQAAQREAREVPLRIARLCYRAVQLIPFLVQNGNRHLISDLETSAEMLSASFRAAIVMVRVNQ